MNDTTTVAAGGLATDETNRLISSDKVEGTPVYNPKGERLGKVHHLMIDKYTGQVAYAVMSLRRFSGHRREVQSAALENAHLRHPFGGLCCGAGPQQARECAELHLD